MKSSLCTEILNIRTRFSLSMPSIKQSAVCSTAGAKHPMDNWQWGQTVSPSSVALNSTRLALYSIGRTKLSDINYSLHFLKL